VAAAAAEVDAPDEVVVELRLVAADAPDEDLALALERVAVAGDAAGDHERTARLWQQAAQVGTDARRRPRRLHESAEAALRAGRLRVAQTRYGAALAAGLQGEPRARAHLALGRVEHTAGSPRRALAQFAAAAAATDLPALRVRARAEGVLAAMYAADPVAARELADAVDGEHDPDQPKDRLLAWHARGAAAALSGDVGSARPLLADAVEQAAQWPVLDLEPELVLWVISAGLFPGGPTQDVQTVVAPALEQLRLRGDLTWLPRVVRLWGVHQELAGRWLAAYASYEEAVDLSRAAEQTTQLVEALHALAQLEALRGERGPCLAHADEAEQLLAQLDVPFLASRAWLARGLLHLGLGEPAAAAAALAPATDVSDGVPWRADAVADLVEALVHDGRREEAVGAARIAPSLRTDGVLAEDDVAGAALLLGAADEDVDPLGAARCRLLAGERLRRSGLRRQARDQLRTAADVFLRAGARPWLQRAQEELRASGESLPHSDGNREALTGSELRVAGLVAEGRPTREVAALLFVSPKTVEFHLSRIYRKLGVRGRAELAHRLATD
jgi:ATP/maltotriose-dependent transcriptional regulator MalT